MFYKIFQDFISITPKSSNMYLQFYIYCKMGSLCKSNYTQGQSFKREEMLFAV